MRRTVLYCTLVVLCPLFALPAWLSERSRAEKPAPLPEKRVSEKLPLTQVVLFNTGLGYFQREGEIDGEARIELAIPSSDINDLLKTIRIDNAGKPTSISYDGTEGLENKLRSFGVDLTSNPTLGQLLNQARGQSVEIVLENKGGESTTLAGRIVGMESHFENQTLEVHYLNLLGKEGVRRLPLDRLARVRFLDPGVETEFRQALSVLSTGQSDQRKLVGVQLSGDGKRRVKIGHVAETPIWKATYRLMLDNRKPMLQGMAIVENTTEEDWKDVRVVLVSGRPITFRMDLAQQLFMPRPKVEPEVYASLRPPTFAPSAEFNDKGEMIPRRGQLGGQQLGGIQLGGGLQLGGGQQLGGVQLGTTSRDDDGGMASISALYGINRYQTFPRSPGPSRLSYEELQKRRAEMLAQRKQATSEATRIGQSLAALGEGIDDMVTNADTIGEGFRLALEPRVSIPRHKAALVTMLSNDIAINRISIYTPTVHPRFPMMSVKMKNNTGQHLQQGPVAVFEGDDYVGDCRMPDMQPNQERLLTYALDLGVEVRPEQVKGSDGIISMEIRDGTFEIETRETQRTVYQILNRAKSSRVVQIEHPVSVWKFTAESEKPAETTRQQYRFAWTVEAGKTERKAILEYRIHRSRDAIRYTAIDALLELAKSPKASAAVKAAIAKVVEANRVWTKASAEESKVEFQLKELTKTRDEITSTLAKLPVNSTQHKRYLTQFDEVDAEIAKVKPMLKEKQAARSKAQEDYDALTRSLNAK